MIIVELLDPRDEEIERNPKPTKSKIEEVRLFDKFDSQLVKVGKKLTSKT